MAELLEQVGAESVRARLTAIVEQLSTPEQALEAEMAVLEQAEATLFESFADPTYVRSGATRASLTQATAEGAIRRIHGSMLEFGTSIWYATFQRKVGEPSGKPRGRKRVGPSLILKLGEGEVQAAAHLVMDRILGHA